MDELAALAAPHYDPRVEGGSAHLEIGRALRAARDRTAHLVISLKPFGCLPSSALSDGILSVLARGMDRVRFLAVETTGDADATTESRIEMAVHTAALAAIEEMARACADAGIEGEAARRELGEYQQQRGPAGGAAGVCLLGGGADPEAGVVTGTGGGGAAMQPAGALPELPPRRCSPPTPYLSCRRGDAARPRLT